ncbi:MAG TPA: SseB family protein [Trebonia sp.]|nr:SseB family protein [Trebonia sp.]
MATARSSAIGRPQGDDGRPDPNVTSALAAWASSAASEQAALLALASARLLVPVVAMLTEADAVTGAEKESEMALPTLIGGDGRAAIIAFTGIETLTRWRPDARPVPTPAARVWHAAVAEGQAVVIDVAGPVPFVVEGARLAALAAGQAPPPPHEDKDVIAVVSAVAASEPAVVAVQLAPATGDARGSVADLAVTLRIASASDVDAATRAAQEITARLSSRFRRGLEIAASV